MSREIYWTKEAVKDLEYWRKNNRPVAVRIAKLVNSILIDPFKGIGKPEPLRFSLAGRWSRRITIEDRLVYEVTNEAITIISCRFHY
jgi:toxin YoeB